MIKVPRTADAPAELTPLGATELLKTLEHYSEQFATLTSQREHLRSVIAQWWTLLEERPH